MNTMTMERGTTHTRRNYTGMYKGEIWMADLGQGRGSEQAGVRPVVIISNNKGNHFAPTVQIAPVSSGVRKPLPTHVKLRAVETNLYRDSVVFLEQTRTISKERLQKRITKLDGRIMREIDMAIKISFGLVEVV